MHFSVKKALRFLLMAGGGLSVIVVAYYLWVVWSAYQYTAATLIPQENAAQYPLQVSSLTDRQLDILLKVEDPNFFQHHGVDFSTPGAGITTITQSLVKHLYFKEFKPGIAKIQQTLIARFALDPLMSKEMQLRRFINTVYLGAEAQGFEQAAMHYYHCAFDRLSEEQYMAVVAMIIAPSTFNIETNPQRIQERVARIQRVVNGSYRPKGLFDLYYGKLDEETRKNLPPASYFEKYYK